MKTIWLILSLTIASTLSAEESKPINPALLYWQAASELPQRNNDQAKELADVAAGKHAYDVAKDKDFLGGPITMHLIRKAADSTADCDWGLPLEDGPATILPHLSKIREMGNLAIVQAEALFAEGKVKEGTEWLLVSHRMARHAGAGDILISYLVQAMMETNSIRAAARHCLGWDAETRQSYTAGLQTLPPLHSAQAAFHGESNFVNWMERILSKGDKRGDDLKNLLQGTTSSDPSYQAMLTTLQSPEEIKATIGTLRDLQGRMETASAKPWPEAQAELKALTDEADQSPHLLVKMTFSATNKVAEKGFMLATLRTMLDAALQHGPQLDETTAATYHDSLEGEPLRLQKESDGTLSLVAARQHPAGKDLSLKFGK